MLITLHVCCICPSWQMYDAGDFKFLTTVASPPGQNWMGGDFVAADFVLVWSRVSWRHYFTVIICKCLLWKAISYSFCILHTGWEELLVQAACFVSTISQFNYHCYYDYVMASKSKYVCRQLYSMVQECYRSITHGTILLLSLDVVQVFKTSGKVC